MSNRRKARPEPPNDSKSAADSGKALKPIGHIYSFYTKSTGLSSRKIRKFPGKCGFWEEKAYFCHFGLNLGRFAPNTTMCISEESMVGQDQAVRELEEVNEMVKAKEVMTTDVLTVTRETPITEAVRLLVENDVTGLPVVAEDMTLLGILTEKDVLRLLQADEFEKEATVEDFMTTPAIYFSEDESLSNISDCLMTYDFRRVPITSGTRLVGIISRRDILMYMLEARIVELPASKV